MNKEQIKGRWNELKGDIKQKWGNLSEDDMDHLEGTYDKIVGKIQQAYGKTKEEAQREFDTWYSSKYENDSSSVNTDRTA